MIEDRKICQFCGKKFTTKYSLHRHEAQKVIDKSCDWKVGRSFGMLGKKHSDTTRSKMRHKHNVSTSWLRHLRKRMQNYNEARKGKKDQPGLWWYEGTPNPAKDSETYRKKMSESMIRRIQKNGGVHPTLTKSLRGRFYSQKNGCFIKYESSYELCAFEILEQMDVVKAFRRCPFVVKYQFAEKDRLYIPDVLVEYVHGYLQVIEIKGCSMVQDDINQAKFRAARKFFRPKHIAFSVWTEKTVHA